MVSTRSGRQATGENRSQTATNQSAAMTRTTIKNPTTMEPDGSQGNEPAKTKKRVRIGESNEEEGPVPVVLAKTKGRAKAKIAAQTIPEGIPQPALGEPTDKEQIPSSVESQALFATVKEWTPSAVQETTSPILSSADLEEIKELVRCTVCLEILSAPIYSVDACAHKFCSTCITSWIAKHNDCPQCRKPVGRTARDTFAESIVELLIKFNPLADQSLPWSPRHMSN